MRRPAYPVAFIVIRSTSRKNRPLPRWDLERYVPELLGHHIDDAKEIGATSLLMKAILGT